MPVTPPIPIPPGQRIVWLFPTQVEPGPINPGATDGSAVGSLTFGEVQQFFSSPLINPGWSVIWSGFELNLPVGATVEHIYPVIQSLDPECAVADPQASYGTSTVGYLALNQEGFGGAGMELHNNAGPQQCNIFNPAGGGIAGAFDPSMQIGIQLLTTAPAGAISDSITALRPCVAVYYSGGSATGDLMAVPTLTLISSGPSVGDDCLDNSTNQRKIGSVVIDWTTVPVLGNGTVDGSEDFSFPEYTYLGAAATAAGALVYGYQSVELDLKTAFNGQGLDEVRAVFMQNRAAWGTLDDGGALIGPSDAGGIVGATTNLGPTFLTSELNQMTVNICDSLSQNSWFSNKLPLAQAKCFPFFAIGPSLKVRFLNLLTSWDATVGAPVVQGKVQALFFNYDVASFIDSSQILVGPA